MILKAKSSLPTIDLNDGTFINHQIYFVNDGHHIFFLAPSLKAYISAFHRYYHYSITFILKSV